MTDKPDIFDKLPINQEKVLEWVFRLGMIAVYATTRTRNGIGALEPALPGAFGGFLF